MAQPRRRMRAAASPRPAGPPSAARRHLVRTPGLPGRGGAGGARGCREALRGPAAGLKSRGWPAEEEEEPAWRMKCPKPCEWGGGAAATALLFPARRGGGGPGRSPQLPSRLLRHIEGPGGCSHPGSGLRVAGPDPSGPSRAPRPIPLGPQPFAAPLSLLLLSSSEHRSARRQSRPGRCSASSEVLRSLRKTPQIGSWPSAPKARCEPLGSRGAACSWGAALRLAKHPK